MKLKLTPFFLNSIILQIFFFKYCKGLESALILIREECRFQFAPEEKNEPMTTGDFTEAHILSNLQKLISYEPDKYYFFCSQTGPIKFTHSEFRKRNKNNLYFIGTVPDQSNPSVCDNSYDCTWIEINIENYDKESDRDISLHVWGFKLYTENIPADSFPCSSRKSKDDQKYKLDEQFDVGPGLWIFYSQSKKQILGVQYELRSDKPTTTMIWEPMLPFFKKDTPFDLSYLNIFPAHNNGILVTPDSPLEENIPENEFKLMLTSFASINHFRSYHVAETYANLIPIWKKLFEYETRINRFLEFLSKKIGHLDITAGAIELPQEERIAYKTSENLPILVPEILWKIVQYKDKSKKIYGIIIILINSLVEVKKKICESDLCEMHKWKVQTEEGKRHVYCCNLIKNTINNLEIKIPGIRTRFSFRLQEEWVKNFT